MATLQIKHHQGIIEFSSPKIMGIINLTPDSFSDGGKNHELKLALNHAEKLWEDGADILDIGAVSSRSGAHEVSEEEEWNRLKPVLSTLVKESYIISVDTFRPEIAKKCLDLGVHVINDICAGEKSGMFETCVSYHAPIILMHKKGNPQNMQINPQYQDVSFEVFQYFNERIRIAKEKKCFEIMIDPGFGFGKTLDHNYQLFQDLNIFKSLEMPILVGISRKSMITKLFQEPWENLTEIQEALHVQAILKGANILRVHDVTLAKKSKTLAEFLKTK